MKRSCRDPYYFQLVFEYLLHLGLLDTAAMFQKECELQKYFVPPSDNDTESQLKFKLLRYFDFREEDSFFEALNSANFSDELYSTGIKKLLADLHVYFATSSFAKIQDCSKSASSNSQDVEKRYSSAILSYSNSSASPKKSFVRSSVLRLSNFLERYCFNLKDDTEFMPYFSLIDTSNVLHHQLFHQALQDSWVSELRRRLQEYLWLKCPAPKVPDIVLYLPSHFNKDFDGHKANRDKAESCKKYLCCHSPSPGTPGNFGVEGRAEPSVQNFEVIGTDNEVASDFTGNESMAASDSSQNEPVRKINSSQAPHSHHTALFIRRQNQKMSSSSLHLSRDTMRGGGSLGSNEKHEECQRRYIQLKNKFSQLHSDYHNLIGVASELTGALENTARGQQTDLRETLSNCLHIFPELFAQHQHLKRHNKNKGIKGRFSLRSTSCDWKLDIPRIKRHLQEGNVKTRLLVLQALRWAVTRSSNQKRECIMNQFVGSDLLNLQGDTLLRCLLTPSGVTTPHPLQQSAARLLNTLASIQSGRSYLAQNSETVSVAASVLQQQDGISSDLITKSMLVAALQKLSLRRNQRIAMIQFGMVEWLFQQLLNVGVESSYSLEYGTALLMNLCLHQNAKEICVPIAQSVITVLINLLSTPVTQALPYINGILYSLVTNSVLNEAAAELGLGKSLEENILKQDSIEIRKQMEHILQYHKSLLDSKDGFTFPLPVNEGEMMDDDDEELDLLGEELDEQDPVRNIRGELSGEDLLRANYTLPYRSHENSEELTSESEVGVSHASPLILRPTTPRQSTQHSGSGADSSVQMTRSNWEAKAHDQNVKNNWQRRAEVMKENINEQKSDAPLFKSESSLSDGGTNKAAAQSEIEAFSTEPDHSFPNTHIQSSGVESNTAGHSFVVCEADYRKNLPQIAIHLVAKSDETDTDENKEYDDDLDDVQVGGMASTNVCDIQCSQSCAQSVNNPASGSPEVDRGHTKSSGAENSDTSAFTSRPKIPRTPPH